MRCGLCARWLQIRSIHACDVCAVGCPGNRGGGWSVRRRSRSDHRPGQQPGEGSHQCSQAAFVLDRRWVGFEVCHRELEVVEVQLHSGLGPGEYKPRTLEPVSERSISAAAECDEQQFWFGSCGSIFVCSEGNWRRADGRGNIGARKRHNLELCRSVTSVHTFTTDYVRLQNPSSRVVQQ